MLTRLGFLAQLIFPPLVAQDPAESFRQDVNRFAEAWNHLIHGAEQNIWSVKEAKHVSDLFDRLRNSPYWKVR